LSTAKENAAEQSIGSLASEIIDDAQRLVKLHLELLGHEVRADLRKCKHAAFVLVIAHILAVVGFTGLFAMFVGLLAWAAPDIPWWGRCGIVGGALLLVSVIVYRRASKMLKSINPLPDETIQVIKEELQWSAK